MEDRHERLLVVDGDLMVLGDLARQLRLQYAVRTFLNPLEALRSLRAGVPCDILLSDVTLPVMDGVELAKRAVGARPALAGRIVLMTGGTPTPKVLAALQESGLPVVAKPLDLDALRALLARVISRHP